MNWDEEVDVVCIGSGVGGLASAIAAVDAGLGVFVASTGVDGGANDGPEPPETRSSANALRKLGVDSLDWETYEYLDALSQDLPPLCPIERDAKVPVRVVDDPRPAEMGERRRTTAETFVGARLRDWATRCLASPYGVVYSYLADRNMTRMRSRTGETIEAAVIGSVELDRELSGPALADWLFSQAWDRGIRVTAANPLQRLVFEDGQVIGAVVATPAGMFALRARRGVVVATGGDYANTTWPGYSRTGDESVAVCMMSRPASRFGRVELLTMEPSAGRSEPAWFPMNHRRHAIA
jgi:hypothetical protein